MSSLHRAARQGNNEEVAALLAGGADPNAVGIRGFTPLHLAAQQGHVRVARLLLDAGSDPSATHPNRRTALHFASGSGHTEVVRLLAERGAPLGTLNAIGMTPMLEAAHFNHRAVVELLVALGADTTVRDRTKRTASDWLAVGGVQGTSGNFAEEVRARNATPEARASARKQVRKCMAEGLSPEAWAARHGRNTYVWGYGNRAFDDPDAEAWATRVHDILADSALLATCEDQHLPPEELAPLQRRRAARAKRAARRNSPPQQ